SAEEAVAELDGPPQRVRVIGAKPDGRVRLLDGLRLHRRAVQLPVTTLEADAGLGPQPLHQSQPFVEATHQVVGLDPEGREHAATPARADADLDPPARELVERAQA